MIFQTEKWFHVKQELDELISQSFKECETAEGKRGYSPDEEVLLNLDNQGLMHLTVCRNAGRMVGYFISLLTPRHLEYEAYCSSQLSIFLLPEYRKGLTGLKLMQEHELGLRDLGVQKMYGGHTLSVDLSALFKRCGWQEVERVYIKWL